jgi:hypothetical protein
MSYQYYSTKHQTPQETESLLKQTILSSAEGSYQETEKLGSDSEGLWLRSFLIKPGVYNKRGWAVSSETVMQNIYSIVGKPLVLHRDPQTGKADHPSWNEHFSAEANVRAQSSDAIGVVKKVFYNKDDDSYYADSLVTDAKAKEYINSLHGRKLPIPVSPQIVYNPKLNSPNYFSDWSFSHLAVVDKAAYGPAAAVIGACDGNERTCHKELQKINVVAAASASASAEASVPGLELKRDTSSVGSYLIGNRVWAPSKGKRPGKVA